MGTSNSLTMCQLDSTTRELLTRSFCQFHDWMFGQALPFWSEYGCHSETDEVAFWGAEESLTLAGKPVRAGFKRVRVQARQLYVFSQAALYGHEGARQRADRIYQFLLRAEQEKGKWGCVLTEFGKIKNSASNLYDLAFILFSFAWYARLSGSGEPIERSLSLIDWMRKHMAEATGGYANLWPDNSSYREQNPHMHLLEAMLILYDVSGDECFCHEARKLFGLFRSHFFTPITGTLTEFFEKDLSPANCILQDYVEPGHHYEWICLLAQGEILLKDKNRGVIDQLYTFCRKNAAHADSGLIVDLLSRNGKILKRSSRLWVQTEALRAELIMLRRGQPTADFVIRIVANLLNRYFVNCPKGAWVDQLDDFHHPVSKFIPASSFYHIMTGYVEFRNVMKEMSLVTDVGLN